MEKTPTQNVRSLHWIVRGCQLIWKSAKFVWGTIILNILLGAFVTLSFTVPSSFSSLPVLTWVILNRVVIAIIFGVLLSLYALSFVGSKLPPTAFAGKVKRTYLRHMILKKQTLALEGIPRSLMSQSVPLDEVFIPLQLHPYRALTDYPPTESEHQEYLYLSQQNMSTEEMDRIFLEAESTWQYHYQDNEKINIAEFWQLLTGDYPAAVIQGFLGMGKSTLLARLTLYMAHLCLDQSDSLHIPANQEPLIPILLSLKDYSQERNNHQLNNTDTLSLSDYLKIALKNWNFVCGSGILIIL